MSTRKISGKRHDSGTYKLVHEWIVDDTDDWYAFNSKSNGSTDHWITVDLTISVMSSCSM